VLRFVSKLDALMNNVGRSEFQMSRQY